MQSNPKKRKGAFDLSASSVVDLKAELAKHQAVFQREKATASSVSAASRKQQKKPTTWGRKNAGVEQRQNADRVAKQQMDPLSWEAHKAVMEKKASLYEKMLREGDEGSSETAKEERLVDFTRKHWDTPEVIEAQEKQEIPEETEDDPWVEYTDEFGRVRVARQSEVPQMPESSSARSGQNNETLPKLLSDDMRREMERQRWEAEAQAELKKGPAHYDSSKEIRTKGVGFYKFGSSEEERQAQMEELKSIRQKTEIQRSLHRNVKDKRKEQLEARMASIRAKSKKQQESGQVASSATEGSDTNSENITATPLVDADVLGTAKLTNTQSVVASKEEVERHQSISAFLTSIRPDRQ